MQEQEAYKPPRAWAAEIAVLATAEERRLALAKVPENLRPIVKTHLRLEWERRRFNRRPEGTR